MKWKFPGTLADAIANHHTPDAEIPKSILLTADIDETGRATSDMLTERVVQHLGMSEEDARATIEAGEQAGADLAAQFNRH